MIVKTICKNNRYYCEDTFKYQAFRNLVVGECYTLRFESDEQTYQLLVDGKEIHCDGYVFFDHLPLFEKYEFNRFFYSKKEMRNIKIDSII